MELFFENMDSFLHQLTALGNELDVDSTLLNNYYHELTQLGALALLIPEEEGGMGGQKEDWINYNIKLAQFSGALLFLQAQHQLAITQLKKIKEFPKVQELFEKIIAQRLGLGVGLAANRHLLSVENYQSGYLVSGRLLWVTGWQHFSHILFSFDHQGYVYYCLLPFENKNHETGNIKISPIIKTTVFESTNTVSMSLENWYIDSNEILAWQTQSLHKFTQHPAIFNFAGAAKALLAIAKQGKYAFLDLSKTKQNELEKSWQDYYQKMIKDEKDPLELRAEGLLLAEQCALLARISCGAESLLASHPITRISREIWQYTIAGYSKDQAQAYLTSSLC
jgi:hypothetical protein